MILSEFGMMPEELSLEEAKTVVRGRKIYLGTVIGGMWLVVTILQVTVLPKLQELYLEFGTEPAALQAPWVIWAILLGATVVAAGPAFSGRWEEELEKKVQAAQPPGKIKFREIPGKGFEALVLVGMGLVVGYLVMSIIGPIYSLTSGY